MSALGGEGEAKHFSMKKMKVFVYEGNAIKFMKKNNNNFCIHDEHDNYIYAHYVRWGLSGWA